MADMELRVDDSFKNSLVPVEFNYEELKGWLTESLAKYKGRVFTDEQMPEAKQISANLNKVSKAINDQRIAIKKLYLEPYNEFESRCKELSSMCDSVREEIKAQVDSFNDAKREQKLELLRHFFRANCKDDASEILTWERIEDKRWGNATYSQTTAEQEILQRIDEVNGNVEIIREMESPFEIELMEEYRQSLDLRKVFDKKKALEERKKAADERRKQVEEMLGKKSGQQSMFDTKPEPPKAEPVAQTTEKVIELHMVAKGTKAQFMALRKAVDEIGMTMERVK